MTSLTGTGAKELVGRWGEDVVAQEIVPRAHRRIARMAALAGTLG